MTIAGNLLAARASFPAMMRRVLCLGCLAAACAPREHAIATGAELGTAHPIDVIAAAADATWVLAAQARVDTDGEDGVAAFYDAHGEDFGDEMVLLLFEGPGQGTPIDAEVGDRLANSAREAREAELAVAELPWGAFARDVAGRVLMPAVLRGHGRHAIGPLRWVAPPLNMPR